ncbi:MAG TPA: FAD-dependent oxidoreductase [Gemmatimonadaceae bacterium]|jgi:NADPH-dependent 2,4-dienoyl-CoA reductase/sulfur reductase-like enzyme/nitrite reductase/ring-hydroxylating ferredoxin subunit
MGGEQTLSGPDLGAGISASTLKPGDKLLGHAQGEAVLLARIGDDFLAIGATCSHYGGPLAEGVIEGDTVHCPWHHACFSLRNGEALRAPALNPVACWKVERRDDNVVVTGKVERDPLAPSYPIANGASAAPQKIVIVGMGAAGSAATEMLRRCGYTAEITVVDNDSGSPYDRPNLSKDYLAGNAPEEWIPLRPEDFYEQHRVNVVRARAARIDVRAKKLEVEGHANIPYDALLLATGAEPIHLKMPGDDLPHVHYLRSLRDSRAIIEAAKTKKRALVMGASFIGLEVAASLRSRGLDVHVTAPEKLPLERVLGEHLGNYIKSLHEEKGVVFHLGHTGTSIEKDAVTLDDGTRVPADLVVIGVGVKPRLELAEQAGLAMEKGVVVNEFLETSVPGIYAAGDIARWPDAHTGDRIRVEHWVLAQRQGQAAARNILGAKKAFDQVPFFWSAHYDVSINYVGHAEKWDRVDVDGKAANKDVSVRYVRGKKVLALATIFRDQESLNAEIEWEREGRGT